MAGRIYTVSISGTASPAAVFDFLELNPNSVKPVRIRRMVIAQTSVAAADEEQLPLTVYRAHTTGGSGGSAPTPIPLTSTEAAAAFTAETMNTTVATGGTPVILLQDAWNTRAGRDLVLSADESPGAVNERILVRSGAPAAAVTIYATFWVEEIG